MITQAIILAGGLGTRLRDAVPELPKCMAPVNGKPFIAYVTGHLQRQGITHFIFALGYKSEAFESFLNTLTATYQLSIEKEPLGTGGAIKLACTSSTEENVLVANGDTLFNIDLKALSESHVLHKADCTLSLKPMNNFDRYGVVELKDSNAVASFHEKKHYQSGLINGGVYALKRSSFMSENLPGKFSFEKDYLERFVGKRRIYGVIQDQYFIDIGIPEDYAKAQRELS